MTPITTAMRYWETARWLKPQQVAGRIWFRLSQPRPELRPAPSRRAPSGPWVTPARRPPSLIGPQKFRLLNAEAELADCGWDNPDLDKLWRYNQHYFDDLNAENAEARRDWHAAQLANWHAENPPGRGTGWEPYPTSLRIVNWIKWALRGEKLGPELIESLAVQTRWLNRRLEHHLLGNHLFANAKALVFAGLWFDGAEAGRWRDRGTEILATELREQVLADGGQFERSPMYHALALEDVLDLVNILRSHAGAIEMRGRTLLADLEKVERGMRAWLAALSHPDGEIAFFNDAAMGVAPHRDQLEAYAGRLALPGSPQTAALTWLPQSGYARLAQPDAVLLCDLALIGPDYLPGHAHADTLSFELSLFGERVLVNSGTSVYGTSAERERQRGTPAHSTVTVAGRNSSDVWSSFRVGARARPRGAQVERQGDALIAACAHDGYRSLPGRPIHHRRWELSSHRLRVQDAVSKTDLPAEARFHLHPDVACAIDNGRAGRLTLASGRAVRWRAEGGDARLEPSSWHPQFGISLPARCLVLPLAAGRANLELDWS